MTTTRRRGLNTPDPERKGGGRGQFIPFIVLKEDLDRVRFRLLSEINEDTAKSVGTSSTVLVGEFHRVEKRSSRNKLFFKDIICGFDLEEDDGTATCIHCDNDLDKRTRFMGWAYVYAYFHQYQNPEYNPRDPKTEDKKWPQVKLGQTTAYKEEIEDYQIWMDGYYMREDLKDIAAMNGKITDRDFLVTRHGAKNSSQVQRKLKDLPESALKPEFLEKLLVLPLLEKIATGEIETMDGKISEATTDMASHEEVSLDDLPDEFGDTDLGDDKAEKTPDDLVDDLFGEGPSVEDHPEETAEASVDDDALGGLPF